MWVCVCVCKRLIIVTEKASRRHVYKQQLQYSIFISFFSTSYRVYSSTIVLFYKYLGYRHNSHHKVYCRPFGYLVVFDIQCREWGILPLKPILKLSLLFLFPSCFLSTLYRTFTLVLQGQSRYRTVSFPSLFLPFLLDYDVAKDLHSRRDVNLLPTSKHSLHGREWRQHLIKKTVASATQVRLAHGWADIA